ncbi:MAG: hypothetical protein WD066_18945 [Planctomycetaceae bacterium]
MHKPAAMMLSLALSLPAVWSTAAQGAEPVERQGALAGLPSAPGPHLAKIKALGGDAWVELGSPEADPQWGKARGRSWSSRMAFAPDLAGAFLNGQGVHGYIKPDGYFMDDIWLYDLHAHRWICLYPGTDTRNFVANIKSGELKTNDDGQLVDQEGRVVPFSSIAGHSYQDHVYDPDLGRYVFGGHTDGIGSEQHVRDQEWCKTGRELLLAQGKTDKAAGAPFHFDTLTGLFERPPAGAVGRAHGGAGGSFQVDLMYLPTKKLYWQHSRGIVRFADAATHSWKNAKAVGSPPPGDDVGICHDSKRDVIYITANSTRDGRGNPDEGAVFIYDVAKNSWSRPPRKGNPPAGLFSANRSCVHYDAVADKVVVLVFMAERNALGVHVYDPETAAWSEAPMPPPPAFAVDRGCGNGFYSPEVNAHIVFRARDSDAVGRMWAYRFERPTK